MPLGLTADNNSQLPAKRSFYRRIKIGLAGRYRISSLPTDCEIVMNRISYLSAGSHSQDNGCLSGNNITPGPNTFFGCLTGFRLGNDIAPSVQLDIRRFFG